MLSILVVPNTDVPNSLYLQKCKNAKAQRQRQLCKSTNVQMNNCARLQKFNCARVQKHKGKIDCAREQKYNCARVKECKSTNRKLCKRAKFQLCKRTRVQKHKGRIDCTRAQLWKIAKCALVDWRMQEEEFASSELRESLCEAGRGATYVAHR